MISYLVSRRGGQVRFVDVVVLIVDAYARVQRLWLCCLHGCLHRDLLVCVCGALLVFLVRFKCCSPS